MSSAVDYNVLGHPRPRSCSLGSKPLSLRRGKKLENCGFDRMVPTRSPSFEFDVSAFQVSSPLPISPLCEGLNLLTYEKDSPVFSTKHQVSKVDSPWSSATVSGETHEYCRKMKCFTRGRSERRILQFQTPTKYRNGHRRYGSDYLEEIRQRFDDLSFASNPVTNSHISSSPVRILDMPNVRDDYYINVLDWSVKNVVAVALNERVYCWDANKDESEQVQIKLEDDEFVTSLKWDPEGNYLAIGCSNAEIQLCLIVETARLPSRNRKIWDVEKGKCEHTFKSHTERVGVLAWRNKNIFVSGSRSGCIQFHDLRNPEDFYHNHKCHELEVCGLAFNRDFTCLASGGNDNRLTVLHPDQHKVLWSTTAHEAAVKCVAFANHQSSLLATGAGAGDGCIRLWNGNSGKCLTEVDTASQICSMVWSRDDHELFTSHGIQHNNIIAWKYPSMQNVKTLRGHSGRVLHLAINPKGDTLASVSSDEYMYLWQCADSKKKTKQCTVGSPTNSLLLRSIR